MKRNMSRITLKKMKAEERRALARLCSVHDIYLKMIGTGDRNPSAELACLLEAHSGGTIKEADFTSERLSIARKRAVEHDKLRARMERTK